MRALRASMDAFVESITEGDVSVAEAIGLATSSDARAEAASNLYVVAVVEAAPGLGKVAARRLLAEIGVAETTRLGELTDVERHAIIDSLDGP